jgi:hypothetical protein
MMPDLPFVPALWFLAQRGVLHRGAGVKPRYDCGYCLDDIATTLIAMCARHPTTPALDRLTAQYFISVMRSQAPDGCPHNRLDGAEP